MAFRKGTLAPLLLLLLLFFFLLLAPACSPLLGDAALGGPSPPPSGSLSVSFIDVGQGDGVLVQAGGTSHLIDAGRPEEGPNVVDFLRGRGVERLDGIVVSNPDADHIGGFLDVLEAFEVEAVYVSGDEKGTLSYNSFLGAVGEEGSEVRVVRAGARMDWGGVRADACVPKHPVYGAAIPRGADWGRRPAAGVDWELGKDLNRRRSQPRPGPGPASRVARRIRSPAPRTGWRGLLSLTTRSLGSAVDH
jgi:hypothetical protein